jgi:exopolyphosphatase/guanosine-5'-triphosphate,3'-diphosphate pyrophosphatase
MLLMALVARYHRRASPKPNHEGYVALDRERRIAVSKLAAILRVGDALDRSYSQRVDEIRVFREKSKLVIAVPDVDDLSLEQVALKQTGSLFEEIFGIPVLLRTVRS